MGPCAGAGYRGWEDTFCQGSGWSCTTEDFDVDLAEIIRLFELKKSHQYGAFLGLCCIVAFFGPNDDFRYEKLSHPYQPKPHD